MADEFVPDGWFSDVKADWHRTAHVKSIRVNGGRVEVIFADGSSTAAANYGEDVKAAEAERMRLALKITN